MHWNEPMHKFLDFMSIGYEYYVLREAHVNYYMYHFLIK